MLDGYGEELVPTIQIIQMEGQLILKMVASETFRH